MKRLSLWLLLRVLAVLDSLWFAARGIRARSGAGPPTPGAGIQSCAPVRVLDNGSVSWPCFSTLAHSFWRAQELTLFRRHREYFSEPVVDLGCGDMLFGRMAGFPEQGFGVDYDLSSLWAASASGSRLQRVRADAACLPLADGRMAVCLSNSVLEHLADLDRCFDEAFRVLRPGGCFLFTMTLSGFASHLRYWSGSRDADFWERLFGHLQQAEERGLRRALLARGFVVETCLSYQPSWATGLYRLLVSPVVQFVERRLSTRCRTRLQQWLAGEVEKSLEQTVHGEGACAFILARKK